MAIAVHTALQVFSPRPYSRSESGLYRYRLIIYPLCILTPFLLAGLAFIRHAPAYLAQGPVCSLPIRPYWYRLALSWTPRYVIMASIVILYTAIYVHVALQFGSMRRFFGSRQDSILDTLEPDRDDSVQLDVMSDASRRHSVLVAVTRHASLRPPSVSHSLVSPRDVAALDPRASSSRNQSGDTTLVDGSSDRFDFAGAFPATQQQQQQQQRDRDEDKIDRDKSDKEKSDFSVFENSALANSMFPPIGNTDGCLDAHTGRRLSTRRPSRVPLPPMRAAAAAATADVSDDILTHRIVTPAMRAKRAAIQRQLRLLFAYPLCYILTWLLPLVQNGLNYSDHFAQHPVFAVTLLAYLSLAAMGAMDALVFAWREKPWRLIPGADGSFVGSLRPWAWRGDAMPEPLGDRANSYASAAPSATWPASPGGQYTPAARPSRRASALDGVVNGCRGDGDDGDDASLPALVDAGGLLGPPPAFSPAAATAVAPTHARRPSSSAAALLAALPGLAPLTEEDMHDADADADADAALGSLRTWDFAPPQQPSAAAAVRTVEDDKPPPPSRPPPPSLLQQQQQQQQQRQR